MASEQRFGFEWNKYSKLDPQYENQFKNWTYPLDSSFWQGKMVLDAGCGMGRNSYWPLKYGSSLVTSFDFDKRSVEAAKRTLAEFDKKEIIFSSVYDITWENKYDVVFSIGVIHHLADPKQALKNLVKALKPGGRLLIWVYSYEGNEWITKLVDPVRINITSKLPVRLVHFLSYFVSIPLWLFVKIFRGPSSYLKQLATFKFWHLHSIVFDQLIPTIANYWKKEEVEALLSEVGLSNFEVHNPPNKSGWIGIGVK